MGLSSQRFVSASNFAVACVIFSDLAWGGPTDLTPAGHGPHAQSTLPFLAIGAVAAVAAMIVLLALCAGKPKRTEEDVKMDQDTSLRTVRDRSATIAMETNPLFRSQKSHAPVVVVPVPVSSAGDLDEDELANAGGQSALENERRTTMYKMMMEEERLNKQKSKKGGSGPPAAKSTGLALQLDSAHPAWMHVGLTKPFAEQMLLLNPSVGLFLIRTKKVDSGQYALSYVRSDNGSFVVAHHAVTRSPLGDFLIDSRTLPGEPRTLDDVVSLLRARNHFIQGQLGEGVAEIRDSAAAPDQPMVDVVEDDLDT